MELGHTVSGMTTDTLNEKTKYAQKLLMTLEAHQSVENGINANLSLSQQGQMEARKKVGTNETAQSLKWMKNVIEEMQQKDRRYESQFNQIDSGIKDPATIVYMWGKLDMLDANARIKQFCLAAEANQVVVLSAMLENPFGPMVNEEVKERALTERAKRLFPRDYENFEQNELLLEFLVTFRDWVVRWLRKEVGVDISVIRTNFGDEIADALTGLPQLAGV
jgi:hypothetical protein